MWIVLVPKVKSPASYCFPPNRPELKTSVKELSNDIQFAVVELKKLVGIVGSKLLLAE